MQNDLCTSICPLPVRNVLKKRIVRGVRLSLLISSERKKKSESALFLALFELEFQRVISDAFLMASEA